MAGQAQEPVTFEDVTVFLSRAEWDALPPGQRELYRDVVSDTYELLTSLGYPGPKPDILHRLERGEEPWICSSPGCSGCLVMRMNPGARGARQLRSARNAQGVTWDTRCGPEGILGTGVSQPALSQAVGARKRAMPLKDRDASQESEGCVKTRKSQGMSLQDVFRDVLKAVGYILDSMCRKFELQGFSQGKSIWPIIIQIDNLAEIGKP
ncbi:zinc finger protein 34-like [Chamaea fasciata]|uniref:zinc finger protein 34-like n=1 Tax=Chamaea fasciata TaxID=190680 RepID=UPI00336A2EF5